VPLAGHTRGQTGVAVDTGEGWILHCGDAYYVKEELRQKGKVSLGVRGFRRFAHIDFAKAMNNLDMIKRIAREHGDEVTFIASHDQFEYRNLFGKPLD
jgi:glyoxylase-like metal-dependent hydrolase (beta-lactamase superfamily II)